MHNQISRAQNRLGSFVVPTGTKPLLVVNLPLLRMLSVRVIIDNLPFV